MNVTQRGYYTQTYLDNVHKHKSSRRRRDEGDHLRPRSSENALSQHVTSPATQTTFATKDTGAFSNGVLESPSTYRDLETNNFLPESPESQMTGSVDDSVDTQHIHFDPDHLHEELTPAQLNVLQWRNRPAPRRRRRRRSYYDDYDSYYSRRDDYTDYDSRYDDSRYDESLYTYDKRASTYDDYYDNHSAKVPPGRPHRQDPRRENRTRRQGDDYYIQQKKAIDEAEFYKPKPYTHKTFMEVFNDPDEQSSRYNPMDQVFDDPEKIKEQEQNQKLKKAFKTLQTKLGKDDYSNYDYYQNKAKPDVTNEIFVTGESDDSDDEVLEADKPEQPQKKKKKNFKKLWKAKTKQLKKELGRDYLNNMEKQWEMEEAKMRLRELEMLAEQEEKEKQPQEEPTAATTAATTPKSAASAAFDDNVTAEPIVEEPDDASDRTRFFAGPRSEFHPAWNYLLSWLTYEQPKPRHAAPLSIQEAPVDITKSNKSNKNSKIEVSEHTKQASKPTKASTSSKPIVKEPVKKTTKKIRINKEQVKNFNKNISKLKNMWTLPANQLFEGQYPNGVPAGAMSLKSGKTGQDTLQQSLPQSIMYDMPELDADTNEFIIELDDDEETFDEELFFNPHTGQLEREPPTSYSSMDPAPVPNSPAMTSRSTATARTNKSMMDTSGGAKAIISNINSMIKSIKLMKIIFAPIDIIAESFPNLQTLVIMLELVIFVWILYELSLLVDALCMMIKAVCAPMIAMGRFMNRIM